MSWNVFKLWSPSSFCLPPPMSSSSSLSLLMCPSCNSPSYGLPSRHPPPSLLLRLPPAAEWHAAKTAEPAKEPPSQVGSVEPLPASTAQTEVYSQQVTMMPVQVHPRHTHFKLSRRRNNEGRHVLERVCHPPAQRSHVQMCLCGQRTQ